MLIFFAISIALAGASPVREDVRANNKIVGGAEISPLFKYNFLVALVNSNSNDLNQAQFCGGTLIHSEWVLTAAHCTHEKSASQISVGVFLHTLLPNFGHAGSHESACSEVIQVAEIYQHPSYDEVSILNDIALLRLEKSPNCDGQIDYATLATSTPVAGTDVTVAGWGALWAEGSDGNPVPLPPQQYPGVPSEVVLKVTSEKTCGNYVGASYMEEMFCAGFAGGGKDSCQGDSGGPLFAMSGSSTVLSGIVSWGDVCALSSPGFGVYTRVSTYAGSGGWIEQVMGSDHHGDDGFFKLLQALTACF